ncbi:fungal-specific transcription factor domain-containing protein [Amylostereum chailletii]|nr:fungal-specific transcription factor domain-containing protein [Amylostereum chailletii]
MSSSEDDHDHDARDSRPPQVKKRRVQTLRACDRCRLKKIRCDGTPSSGQKCSHCAISEATCIFTEGIKKRAPPKKYVDGLESRLERLEALLSRLHPDHDFSHELEDDVGSPPGPMSPESAGPHCAPKRSVSHSSAPSPPQLPSLPHLLDDAHDDLTHSPEAFESDDDEEFSNPSDVSRQFRNADLNASLNRFYGKSSSVRLFRRALTLNSEVSGIHYNLEDEFQNSPFRRPDFWKIHPWERARFVQARSPYTFPEPDLMRHLLANFFHLGGAVCPLFHRPTFEKQVADGLHLVDEGFGGVVSLVCALGSRMSNDPRVFLDNPEKPNHPHSAGWRWFNQVQLVRNLALADPTLHDLQICALAVLFMHGSSPPQACWTLIGIGLRMAQDVGAHRRHAYLDKPLVEMELWKRAFWVLFTLDTWMSSFLGRTCALPLDSIDLEFPIECDDEYWLHPDPEKAFKQPPGKPSKVSYYSLDKHKIIAQIGRLEWETRVVTELDSALNKWFDSLPDHLRWDPTRENELQFFQTACLHAGYYMVQMTIHRPFIPSSRKESSLSFPSLAICCNSARGCSHVLEVQRQRMPGIATPSLLLPAFMSGIVLLLGIWGAKRSGLVIDSTKQMHDVYNCMRFLGSGEMRWPIAGRLRDLLRNLSAVGELPLPESPPSQKRDREGETENEDVSPTPATTAHARHHRHHQHIGHHPYLPALERARARTAQDRWQATALDGRVRDLDVRPAADGAGQDAARGGDGGEGVRRAPRALDLVRPVHAQTHPVLVLGRLLLRARAHRGLVRPRTQTGVDAVDVWAWTAGRAGPLADVADEPRRAVRDAPTSGDGRGHAQRIRGRGDVRSGDGRGRGVLWAGSDVQSYGLGWGRGHGWWWAGDGRRAERGAGAGAGHRRRGGRVDELLRGDGAAGWADGRGQRYDDDVVDAAGRVPDRGLAHVCVESDGDRGPGWGGRRRARGAYVAHRAPGRRNDALSSSSSRKRARARARERVCAPARASILSRGFLAFMCIVALSPADLLRFWLRARLSCYLYGGCLLVVAPLGVSLVRCACMRCWLFWGA